MRIWTNTLLHADFHTAMRRARVSYPPMDSLWFDTLEQGGARHPFTRRFTIRLVGERIPGRTRKRNFQQVHHDPDGVVAPTYDEWGMFLRELYEIDPDMKCDYYANRDDFHRKTKGLFKPHPWTLEHPVACTGCVLSDEDARLTV